MKTKREVKGYQFSWGSGGKKWKRGRIQYSEGKEYTGNGPEYIPRIIKTNLDTHEMTVATLAEHKKFLTEEGYEEYINKYHKG